MRSRGISILLFFFCITSFSQSPVFSKIEIDTNYSFRGLSVVDDSVAWVSGIRGVVGVGRNGGLNWTFNKVKGFEKSDFRTLYAFNSREAVIANAGSPAHILRTSDGGTTWETVYTNNDSAAFFDGVDFWNDLEGIIYGDSIKGRMLLLRTSDGGKTWQELPERSRPKLSEGEASFAASGTEIRCLSTEQVVIVTGGKVSRLLISNNHGLNWAAHKTPITQGKSSTGIFSFTYSGGNPDGDFGVIAGGDYLQDALKENHVFHITARKMDPFVFQAPTQPTGGYRECVEFIQSKTVIAVGPGGTDISFDGGRNWKPIAEKGFHVIRKARKGTLVIAAGSKKISVVTLK